MHATEMLQRIGESLGSTATVKSVFGEPIHAEGKTVVPVAKVAYGFGAGADRATEAGRRSRKRGRGWRRRRESLSRRGPGDNGREYAFHSIYRRA